MSIIRWFSLDTVFTVLSIQLFLAFQFSSLDYALLVGLCVGTSLVYMLDRYFDVYFYGIKSSRHIFVTEKRSLILTSLLILALISFNAWFLLSLQLKVLLLFFLFISLIHFWLLRFPFYLVVKDVVVAAIFTSVMMVNVLHLWHVMVIIFLFTYLNLVMHQMIEMGSSRHDYITFFFIILMTAMALSFCTDFFVSFWGWGVALLGHLLLVLYGRFTQYWYEWGEFFYALPFIVQIITFI